MSPLLKSYLGENELNYVDLCRRVARTIGGNAYDEALFFESLIHKEFIPASMILYTAGKPHPCFCSDIAIPWAERERVRDALRLGLGVSLHLPSNESMQGVYEFLLSFKEVLQRDFRPGATMLTCYDTHPELDIFLELKNTHRDLTHVNFSVLCTSKKTLQKISPLAHACGDPGMLVSERMQSEFVAPCGQQALVPWQSIPYAHINLAAHVDNKTFSVPEFLETYTLVKKFLLAALQKTTFLTEDNKRVSLQEKKIGIGLLGLQEALDKLGVSYNDPAVSELLCSIGSLLGRDGVISPTGATSRLLGLTPNIEPKDAFAFDIKTQLDLATALQKNIAGAISKTILLPETASVEQVQEVFTYAWEKGLKGITVFRLNSLN